MDEHVLGSLCDGGRIRGAHDDERRVGDGIGISEVVEQVSAAAEPGAAEPGVCRERREEASFRAKMFGNEFWRKSVKRPPL